MPSSSFTNGQYVELRQYAAPLFMRLGAWAIDGVVMLLWALIGTAIMSGSGSIAAVVVILTIALYPIVAELIGRGQTIGKRMLHIRVVSIDCTKASAAQLALRWLLLIIEGPMAGSVAIGAIILSRHGQRLGDMAAGTLVVRERHHEAMYLNLNDFYFAIPDYRPYFPQASQLTWRQMGTINQAMRTRSPRRNEYLDTLARKTCQVMGVVQNMPSEALLQTVINDYYYQG